MEPSLLRHKFPTMLKAALCCLIVQCFFSPPISAKEKELDPKIKFELPQGTPVRGKVTSEETGEAMPGVNILVQGTSNGTVTDIAGNYTIDVPSDAVLVFSFIGYASSEVPVNGRSTIDVVMAPQTSELREVVVIGYGTVQKRDLTGSVSSIGEEDFNPGIQTSVDQMIQGRTAGVQITQTSSEPGGGVSVRVRGATSLTSGNEPLYVIDGLPIDNSAVIPESATNDDRSPRNPLNALNPGDIKSIEILKDASATAIYGSRGANGVVLITTKKGSAGGMAINYSGNIGIQEVAKKIDMLSAQEYMGQLNAIQSDLGNAPVFSAADMAAVGEGVDWQDEVLQQAPVQSHQLSLSGGSKATQYYASFNYFDQDGIIINTGTKRYGARLNLSHTENKLSFGVNLNTSVLFDDYVPSGVAINQNAGVISTAIQMDPTLPVRNADGTIAQTQIVDLDNPVGLATGVFDQAVTNRTFGTVFAEYQIIDNLKAKINFGSDRTTSRRDSYISKVTKRGTASGGDADAIANETSNYLAEFTMSYEKAFNDNHRINAVAGYTYQEFSRRSLSGGAQNFVSDAVLSNNLGSGAQTTYTLGTNRVQNQLQSFLGRVNYTLMDKYLITGTFRVDGSSRFGADHKYGYFPSLALGWRLVDEAFISELNAFSDLKLRASYGVTGYQEIGNYKSIVLLGTAGVGDAIIDETRFVGIAPIQVANPDLKWESTGQFNVGLDYGLFSGRLSGSIDYFVKNTSDLLLDLPIPSTTGFLTSLQNVGNSKNSGFEFLLTSDNVVGEFNWTSTFNLSVIKNEVTSLAGVPLIFGGSARFVSGLAVLKVGEPMWSYYGHVVDGIFQSPEEVLGSAQPTAKPGELRYRDLNNDGVINADDRTILGSRFPDFTAGLNNSFSYKGFNVDIFLEGVSGISVFNFNKLDSENPIEFRRNRQAYTLNRWTADNPTNENPSFTTVPVNQVNNRIVEDASYLRIKNIRVGYNFPGLSGNRVRSLSVYVTGQNLFTFTNYSGYNPDVNSFGTGGVKVDYNAYPLSKIYTLGLNIGI